MSIKKMLFILLFLITTSVFSDEIILQNNDTYAGCEDTHLSALFSDTTLLDMIADSQTNHSTEDSLHLTR